ncbi:MAG TPA: 30S ribosomal protein S20 [Planctomycetaceae bacterium]|nr:30S ribosomal protein S20 [Planctomycetaceae bacterium]
MPNNRNAAKAMRQSEKRRLRNRAARTSLRTVIRKVSEATATTDGAAAEAAFRAAVKKLDQAASKKFIHKNKAARLKSRLSALLKKPQAAAKN